MEKTLLKCWVYDPEQVVPDNVTAVTVPSSATKIQKKAFDECDSLLSIVFDSPTNIITISERACYQCTNLTTVKLSEGLETIGEGAFGACESLVVVKIPASVKKISEYAFSNCKKLTTVHLSEGLEAIGEGAFCRCESLTAVEIPTSVKTISQGAFYQCKKLTIVKLLEGSLETIDDEVFYDCESLTDINVPTSVKLISDDAFFGCTKLTTVNLSEGLETIGDYAFQKCESLTVVEIPASVKTISKSAFRECTKLTIVKLSKGFEIIGKSTFRDCESVMVVEIPASVKAISSSAFEDCGILTEKANSDINSRFSNEWVYNPKEVVPKDVTAVTVPSNVTKTLSKYAFFRCKKLTTVNLSEGLETIGVGAFWMCVSLTVVEIPASVKRISNSAFYQCTKLTTVKLLEGLEKIGISTFGECKSLTNVEVPASVKIIPYGAFHKCTNLMTVNLFEGLETIGKDAFRECESLTVVKIPTSVRTISSSAFRKCSNLTTVKLLERLETISNGAFEECESLTVVEIPASVKTISSGAFRKCFRLTTIKLSEGLETIGKDAFRECELLTTVEVPTSVRSISMCAFYKCTRLKTIKLLEGLETIGDEAFYDCESLTAVEIPVSVRTISEGAFYQCKNLTTIKLSEGLETIGNGAFEECESLTVVEIPASVKTISSGAFRKCIRLTTIKLSGGLETIGSGAFEECESLTAVDIPASVKTISVWAFLNCKKLTTVSLSEGLETIGEGAFFRCELLTAVEVPASVKTISEEAFYQCRKLTTVKLSEGLESIGSGAFEECESLTIVDVPSSVKIISSSAFRKCTKLTTIKLPKELETICYNVFSECESLTVVDVPASVKTISKCAFLQCRKLTTVKLSEGLETIGVAAFGESSSLTVIEIPSSVKAISEGAFYKCTKLVTVKLLEGLEIIDGWAFGECDFLTVVEIPASVKAISQNAFEDCGMLTEKANNGDICSILKRYYRFLSLPIHALIYRWNYKSTPKKVMLQLLNKEYEKDQSSIEKKDMFEMTALHILCNMPREIDIDILKWCVKKYASAITEADIFGRRPLHSTILAGCTNFEVIKHLSLSESLVADNSGNTPLAYGTIRLGLPISSLLYMYAGEPLTTNSMTGKEQVKKLLEVKAEYIKEIIDSCKPPNYLQDFPPYRQHGWVKFVATIELDTSNEIIDFLRDKSMCNHETIEILAYAKNKDGRAAMDLAKPKIKDIFEERLLFLGRYDLVKGPEIHKSATSIVIEAEDKKMNEIYETIFEEYAKAQDGNTDDSLDKHSFLNALEDMMAIKISDDQVSGDYFRKVNIDKSRNISQQEFVTFCMNELGNRVALKFMMHKDQFERELMNDRKSLESKYVMEVFRDHGNSHSEEIDLSKFSKEENSKDYKYVLVMPFGDRNLDTIFRSERPDFLDIRKIMKQIGEALRHLHEKDIIHGDLKMLNIVRIKDRLVLIDLDASTSVKKKEPIGAKFSSGILPPEMIFCLNNKEKDRKYREYFREQPTAINQVRVSSGKMKVYVVKSFITDTHTLNGLYRESMKIVPRNEDDLPYKLVEASPTIDIWAFGVILYSLCTGKPLFDVNRDDNIMESDVMKELHDWNVGKRDKKLKAVTDPAAKKLLEDILQKDPPDRPQSMAEILNDDFFRY